MCNDPCVLTVLFHQSLLQVTIASIYRLSQFHWWQHWQLNCWWVSKVNQQKVRVFTEWHKDWPGSQSDKIPWARNDGELGHELFFLVLSIWQCPANPTLNLYMSSYTEFVQSYYHEVEVSLNASTSAAMIIRFLPWILLIFMCLLALWKYFAFLKWNQLDYTMK